MRPDEVRSVAVVRDRLDEDRDCGRVAREEVLRVAVDFEALRASLDLRVHGRLPLEPHVFREDERDEDRLSMVDPATLDERNPRSALSDDSPDRLPRT